MISSSSRLRDRIIKDALKTPPRPLTKTAPLRDHFDEDCWFVVEQRCYRPATIESMCTSTPSGDLALGHIFSSFNRLSALPINGKAGDYIALSPKDIKHTVTEPYKRYDDSVRSTSIGPVGAGMFAFDVQYAFSRNFDRLETVTFNPTDWYLNIVLTLPPWAPSDDPRWLTTRTGKSQIFYMITGLQWAIGGEMAKYDPVEPVPKRHIYDSTIQKDGFHPLRLPKDSKSWHTGPRGAFLCIRVMRIHKHGTHLAWERETLMGGWNQIPVTMPLRPDWRIEEDAFLALRKRIMDEGDFRGEDNYYPKGNGTKKALEHNPRLAEDYNNMYNFT
ncbi:hypothetical protein QBC43DRAFT_338982 [Cladorrhinum sp. PSN259]|nr:hypothetical protein QBC43DRAFT_338982 [Cladorrhinum sp. PSN259]